MISTLRIGEKKAWWRVRVRVRVRVLQRQCGVLTCDLWRTAPRSLGAIAVRERSATVTFQRKNCEDFVHCVGSWAMSELWTREEIERWRILSQFVAKRRKTIFWYTKRVGSYIRSNRYQGEWFVATWLEQLYQLKIIPISSILYSFAYIMTR